MTTVADSSGGTLLRDSPSEKEPAGHRIRRWLAAAVTFVGIYTGVSTGVFGGIGAGLLLVGLLLAFPSSPYLSRRLALNGSLLVGWTPVLWWVDWPVPVNHGGAVLAVGAAALVLHGVRSNRGPSAALLQVPICRPADVLIPLSGLAAFVVVSRLALTDSARQVLTILLGGFDNAPHFGMYLMLRNHGATLDALGNAPDGSPWIYASYPQGFHTVVATFADLFAGRPASNSHELVTYAHGVAAVVTFAMVVLSAALVSLPGLRERPLVALGSVIVLGSAFLWQPGVNTLTDGFGNFWLGAAAIAAALMLSVSSRQASSVLEATAVGGLIMLSAHSWIPLAVLGLPAALAIMSRGDGPRLPGGLRHKGGLLLPLSLSALGSIWAAQVVLGGGVEVETVVTAAGGIRPISPAFPVGLLVASVYLFAGYGVLVRRFGRREQTADGWRKMRLLVLVPVLGTAVAAVVLVAQLHTLGSMSYYLLKFIMGADLVLAAVVAAVGGTLLAQVVPVRACRASRARYAVCGLALGGLMGGMTALGAFPSVAGVESTDTDFRVELTAQRILAATRFEPTRAALRTEYVARGTGAITDAWYHALTCSATIAANHRLGEIGDHEVTDRTSVVAVTRRLLARDAHAEVLVAHPSLGPLRQDLPLNQRHRVRGFPLAAQSSPRENADSKSC